jgi:hypothetical protein
MYCAERQLLGERSIDSQAAHGDGGQHHGHQRNSTTMMTRWPKNSFSSAFATFPYCG